MRRPLLLWVWRYGQLPLTPVSAVVPLQLKPGSVNTKEDEPEMLSTEVMVNSAQLTLDVPPLSGKLPDHSTVLPEPVPAKDPPPLTSAVTVLPATATATSKLRVSPSH